MASIVRLEVEDGVGTIRLDRPPMNAIDGELAAGVRAAAREAAARDDVGAVVLWGGERAFAAGADIKMMRGLDAVQVKPVITSLQESFDAVEELPKVVIAAISGYALGGGLELALCADFRFAAADAKVGQPEIALGIIPGAGGTQRLPRLIGPSRAKDLIYSGRHVGAEEAAAIGLVDRVLPDAAATYAAAVEEARRYAAGPRVALRAAKVAVNWGAAADLRAGLVLERELFADLFATRDRAEGMDAFLEKRRPGFAGA